MRRASIQPRSKSRTRRHEADEVAWWLGVLMSIQIVPAAGGSVLHVLAGAPESVHRRGNALCREAWSCQVPRRAELVVAAIEGDRGQQSWENVGRALAAASRAVTDDGAIALCTELADRPGPALQWLRPSQRSADARCVTSASNDRPTRRGHRTGTCARARAGLFAESVG